MTSVSLAFLFLLGTPPLLNQPAPPRSVPGKTPSAANSPTPSQRRLPPASERVRPVQAQPTSKPQARKEKRANPRKAPSPKTGNPSLAVAKNPTLPVLPVQAIASVKVVRLPNGMVVWCSGKPSWKTSEIRFSVQAGTSFDPPKLHGRSRLLSEQMREVLLRPENPSFSSLPPGQGDYQVGLGKDWLTIQMRTRPSNTKIALAHLLKTLRTAPSVPLHKQVRKRLLLASGDFPPPRLTERIDTHLFGKSSRGVYLRGKRRALRMLQPLAVQRAYSKLIRPERSRLLLLGQLDCSTLLASIRTEFGGWTPPQVKAPKTKEQRQLPPQRGFRGQRSFLSQEHVFLYRLPPLQREQYLAAHFVHYVAYHELQRKLRRVYGREIRVQTHLELQSPGGYIVFVVPIRPIHRRKIQQMVQESVGRLLMQPYPALLERRIQEYQTRFLLNLEQRQESTKAWADWLMPQMQLASPVPGPFASRPMFGAMKPQVFRKYARRFLMKSPLLSRSVQPFSLRRIAMFVGALLLLWFFLDLLIRRSRRYDD